MSELTDARKRAKHERLIAKLEGQVVILDRLYQYLISRDDFDLRKKFPREVREEIGRIQIEVVTELQRIKVEPTA